MLDMQYFSISFGLKSVFFEVQLMITLLMDLMGQKESKVNLKVIVLFSQPLGNLPSYK